MSLSTPLTFPSRAPASITWRARSAVGIQPAPLTFEHTVYAWPGDIWEFDAVLPPMQVADAEECVGFLLGLNGMEYTFLMGPANAGYAGARGTWSGQSPLAAGASSAGAKSVAIDGLTAGSTGKVGDWLQFGSGSNSRLHKLVQDFTANGSGQATMEIWPRLRVALSDNAAITLSSPKGVWRLSSNSREWSIGEALVYGVRFSAIEARET